MAASFAVGCLCVYWHNFIDEGDNIAVGVLVTRGVIPYRDVFSHHFPFAYYWAALVSWLCGPSILSFRISVVVFQTLCFGVALWRTPFPLAIGIASLVWRVLAPPYYGNLLVYPNLAAAALLPVAAIALAVAGGWQRARRGDAVAAGLFAAVAVFCDPVALYPVGLALLALVASGAVGAAATAVSIPVLTAVTYLAYLLASGSFGAFVADVIRFNSEVYARYTPVRPLPVAEMVRVAASGLGVLDGRWMHLVSLIDSYRWPDRSLLTGFAFRASVLLASAVLVVRRRFLAAVLLYVLAATEIAALGEERFRATAFVLTALLAAAALASGEWGARVEDGGSSTNRRRTRGVRVLLRSALALFLLWLLADGGRAIVANRQWLSYEANFHRYEVEAHRLRELACGRDDVALVRYPSDPLLYVFSDMWPRNRYLFLFPWVAEVGMDDVVRSLRSGEAIAYLDLEGDVWGHRNRDFLGPLIDFLDRSYHRVARGVYVSPSLAGCTGGSETATPAASAP